MTGFRRKRPRARSALLVLLMGCVSAQANTDEESMPGMALLEFLADWETADGQWLDPVDLEAPDEPAPSDGADEVPYE